MPRLMAAGGRLADLRRMSRDEIVRAAGADRFTRLPDIDIPWGRPGADVVRVIEAAAVATGLRPRPKRVTRDRLVMAIGVSALVALVGLVIVSIIRSARVETVDPLEAVADGAHDALVDAGDAAEAAGETAADAVDATVTEAHEEAREALTA